MRVYLLPHHRLDPRFRYTLEREAPPSDGTHPAGPDAGRGLLRPALRRISQLLRGLRDDYDHMVHGHEQIRLSRLLMMMDRDPDLTLVIPKGMSRPWALAAVRGVIRAGIMAHRSYVARNLATAAAIFVILFLVTPWHVPAFLFLPLLGLYAWRRHREDRQIQTIMTRLLEVRLAEDDGRLFVEDEHLARLETEFGNTASPSEGYRRATEYLDGLDQKLDGRPSSEHLLMYNYYHNIGKLDPYERYQDRIRKQVFAAFKALWCRLASLVRGGLERLCSRLVRPASGPSPPAAGQPTSSPETPDGQREHVAMER